MALEIEQGDDAHRVGPSSVSPVKERVASCGKLAVLVAAGTAALLGGALALRQRRGFSSVAPGEVAGSVGLYALGGQSWRATFAPDGRLQLTHEEYGPSTSRRLGESEEGGRENASTMNKTFAQWVDSAPWEDTPRLIRELVPFIEMEHPVPLKVSDGQAALDLTFEDCTHPDNNQVFSGLRPGRRAYALDVVVFGFDLDTMEVRLNELAGVVDLFCIIEMPFTHKGTPKPLMWKRNRLKKRFAAFHDRILHIVVEGEQFAKDVGAPSGVNWDFENYQMKDGMRQIRELLDGILEKAGALDAEVVMNFADADEIPTPRNVELMKQCEPKKLPIDNGVWMFMGDIRTAFRTDWPVDYGLPYTFGNPTWHNPRETFGRDFGGAGRDYGRYLLGGWHMTNYVYIPFSLMKDLCATEYAGHIKESEVAELKRGIREYFERSSSLERHPDWRSRSLPVETLQQMEPYRSRPELLQPPTVMQNNKERFEAWFGVFDRRLEVVVGGDIPDVPSSASSAKWWLGVLPPSLALSLQLFP